MLEVVLSINMGEYKRKNIEHLDRGGEPSLFLELPRPPEIPRSKFLLPNSYQCIPIIGPIKKISSFMIFCVTEDRETYTIGGPIKPTFIRLFAYEGMCVGLSLILQRGFEDIFRGGNSFWEPL